VNFTVADIKRPGLAKQAANLVVQSCLEHVENLNFVFSESARVLDRAGKFFICELHPFRQYLGREQIIKVMNRLNFGIRTSHLGFLSNSRVTMISSD